MTRKTLVADPDVTAEQLMQAAEEVAQNGRRRIVCVHGKEIALVPQSRRPRSRPRSSRRTTRSGRSSECLRPTAARPMSRRTSISTWLRPISIRTNDRCMSLARPSRLGVRRYVCFYAAAAEDEGRHQEARAILTRLNRERVQFYTTLYVLAELHALVITRRRHPNFALALITRIERSATTIVPVKDDDQAHARAILARRPDKLYPLTDALSFAVMERMGIGRVFTFDRNFAQHGFQLVDA